MQDKLQNKIEAILFYKNEPVSFKRLADILKVSKEEIASAVPALKESFSGRGIVLIQKEEELSFGTAPELSGLIEELEKEELNRELSKATLETLSIVLYKGGATRAEIDFIRGVNSTFTLRLLAMRGLVERVPDPKDARRNIYKPTFDLMNFMGITSLEDLPEYAEVKKKIDEAGMAMAEAEKEMKEETA